MAEADVKIGVELDANAAVRDFAKIGTAAADMGAKVANGFDHAATEAWNDMNRMGDAVESFARDASTGFDEAAAAARKYESQVTAAGKGADRSMRAFTGATANIGAQFQDIAVQAQQGTNWMTVALQQGTQLSGVFSGLGTTGAGAFKAIGAAIMSVLSVQSLLTIGFVGLATVAIQWAMKLIPAAETAEEKLKKNREAIDAIAAAWPDAEKGAEKFLFVLKEVAKQAATDKLTRAQNDYNDALKQTGGALVDQGKWLASTMEGFKNVALPGQLSWAKLMEEVASGEKTWGDVAKEITAAAEAEMFWKTMNASTTNQLSSMLGALSSMEIGVKGADQILAKFSTDMANGEENVLGTYDALIKFRDSLPEGDDKQKVDDLVKSLTPLAQKARDLAEAGGDVHQFADGIDRLSNRIHMQERAQKTAEAQQQKYNDALGEMTDLAKDADNANRKALETERDKAIVAARNIEQVRFARDAYKEQLGALNELIAAERIRANFLAEEDAAQKGYNAALAGMAGAVPAVVQSNAQIIQSNYELALSYAKTKEERDAAADQRDAALQQTAANTAMNSLITQMEKLQSVVPTVQQSAQQALDAWFATAAPINATEQELTDLILKYGELQGAINQQYASMGQLGQILRVTDGTYAGLSAMVTQFDSDLRAGKTTVAEFTDKLGEIRDRAAASDPQLAALINRVIGLINTVYAIGPAYDDASAKALNFLNIANQATAAAAFAANAARQGAVSAAHNMAEASTKLSAQVDGLVNSLKSQRDVLKENYDAAIASSVSIGQATNINKEYEKGLAAITEQERRLEAARKGHGGGGGKGKDPDKVQVGEFGGKDMNLDQLKQWVFAQQSAIDPTIKLREEQEKLALAVQKLGLSQADQIAINKHLVEEYGKTGDAAFDLGKKLQETFDSWGQQVASTLADAIVNGEDLNQVFQDLLKTLLKMILQMVVLEPLMKSITAGFGGGVGFGVPAVGKSAAAVPPSLVAANSNLTRSLPAPGMLGARNATVSSGSGTVMSTVGGITINFGTGAPAVQGDSQKAKALGNRMRDVVQLEMVRQSRPGGLLWQGGR